MWLFPVSPPRPSAVWTPHQRYSAPFWAIANVKFPLSPRQYVLWVATEDTGGKEEGEEATVQAEKWWWVERGKEGWGQPSPVQICEWIQLLSRVLPYPWTGSPFRVPHVLTLLQSPTLRSSLALPSPVSLCLCPTPKHHLLHCIFRDSHKQ